MAAAIVGDRERGLDAVQEGFASAIRRRESFRGEAPLEAWLWRIVVNAARSERRVRIDEPLPVSLETNGRGPEPGARLAVALAELTERQRLVVFLRHYADLDYESIGEVLDISSGTVGATLNAAHTSLRRALEEIPHE